MKVKGSRPGETNYLIPISNGLLCSQHRKRIGVAIWEFAWLIDRTTKEEDGFGIVLGGTPIKYSEIASGLGISERTVAENCRRLAREGYIKMKPTPYGAQILIAKSKKFAFRRQEESFLPQGERQEESFLPGRKKASCQVGRKLPTYIDNTVDSTEDIDALFVKFWEVYPKKVAKKKALKALKKLNPDKNLFEVIIKALKIQLDSAQWTRDGGQYIPYAASWINDARWEDEADTPMTANKQLTQADHYRNLEGKRLEQTQPSM